MKEGDVVLVSGPFEWDGMDTSLIKFQGHLGIVLELTSGFRRVFCPTHDSHQAQVERGDHSSSLGTLFWPDELHLVMRP